MEQTDRLCFRRPFKSLSRRDRHVLLQGSGMHSPNGEIRTDNDAFEVRDDVSVEDACHTSLRLVRMAVAQLEVLSTDADLGAVHRDAVEGVACLIRLACGSVGLVRTALCEE